MAMRPENEMTMSNDKTLFDVSWSSVGSRKFADILEKLLISTWSKKKNNEDFFNQAT